MLRKLSPCKFSLALAVASVLVLATQARVSAAVTPRIVQSVDEGHLITLKGNTRPEARAEYDRGSVATNLVMGDLILVLRRGPEQQAAFEAFLASQADPSLPNYHHWLTPDQIGQQYGPAQADLLTISQWLQNHGFSIGNISKDHLAITFGGTAAQVESTFHTEIHNLQVKGENHIANMTDPKIPEALTPVVVGVKALHNFFPQPLHTRGGGVVRRNSDGTWQRINSFATNLQSETQKPANAKQIRPAFGTGGTPAQIEDIVPYDFATIYNVLPLWTASTAIDGTGQTIAIAGRSNIYLPDIATFRSAFGLPATLPNSTKPPYSVKITNADPGYCPTTDVNYPNCLGDLVENSLDVEWSGAIAKNAQIILVTSSVTTTTTDALLASEQYIVDNVVAPVMNVSYGECELGMGAAENTLYSNLWSKAQGAGIAVFVATGDTGSASCDANFSPQNGPYGAQFGLTVSGFASTPYNTAVGGTDFNWAWTSGDQAKYWGTTDSATNLSNALGYIPETPWNSTCVNPLLVSSLNTNNKVSYTATEWCDYIGTQQVTFTNEQNALDLVNTVGGGGGASNCIDGNGQTLSSCTKGYPKPSWQTALTPKDSVRDIPDVSFFAASGFSGSSYVICVSNPGVGSCSYTQGSEPVGEEYGGTSVASPIMAGVMALVNQKAGAPQGNPNTILYQLAGKETYSGCSSETVTVSSSSCVFNDIDTGTNAMPCDVGSPDCTGTDQYGVLTGNAAGTGYDLATGLGSLNVANFVNSFVSAVAPAVTLSPTSLTFSATEGTAAASQTVTVKNTGGGDDLAITSISITGTNANLFSLTNNNCGSTLAVNASCSFTVAFAPHTFGPFSASVSIADNATGSPQTVSLTGTGTEIGTYALTASTPTAVAPGSPGSATITATPSGSYTSTGIVLTCSVAALTGGHDTPTCSGGSAIVVTAGAATGTVTVNTTAPSTLVRKRIARAQLSTKEWLGAGGAALACVLLFGIPARKRYWKSLLGVLVFMAALGALSGCGGGGGGGGTVTQTDPGTTAGAYTVTVTGTDAAGVVETTTFTLTVN